MRRAQELVSRHIPAGSPSLVDELLEDRRREATVEVLMDNRSVKLTAVTGNIDERVEAIEETVETVLRPVADLVTPERVNAIEQTAYDAQLRIAALEDRVAKLEAVAAEGLPKANAVLDSRIWQALVKSSDLLLRVAGRSGR